MYRHIVAEIINGRLLIVRPLMDAKLKGPLMSNPNFLVIFNTPSPIQRKLTA